MQLKFDQKLHTDTICIECKFVNMGVIHVLRTSRMPSLLNNVIYLIFMDRFVRIKTQQIFLCSFQDILCVSKNCSKRITN